MPGGSSLGGRLLALVAVVAASACLSHDVSIAPVRVAEVAATLRREGSAVVRDVSDDEVRVDASERDGTRGRTLRALVKRCPDRPASVYRPNDPRCHFADEGRPVRVSRVDVWGSEIGRAHV